MTLIVTGGGKGERRSIRAHLNPLAFERRKRVGTNRGMCLHVSMVAERCMSSIFEKRNTTSLLS